MRSLFPVRVFMLSVAVLTCGIASAPVQAMDRDAAAAQVRQSTGGRVLSVEEVEAGGRRVFQVRVLTPSGEVRVVTVDASTGGRR